MVKGVLGLLQRTSTLPSQKVAATICKTAVAQVFRNPNQRETETDGRVSLPEDDHIVFSSLNSSASGGFS